MIKYNQIILKFYEADMYNNNVYINTSEFTPISFAEFKRLGSTNNTIFTRNFDDGTILFVFDDGTRAYVDKNDKFFLMRTLEEYELKEFKDEIDLNIKNAKDSIKNKKKYHAINKFDFLKK